MIATLTTPAKPAPVLEATTVCLPGLPPVLVLNPREKAVALPVATRVHGATRDQVLVVYSDPTPRQAWRHLRVSVAMLRRSLGRALYGYFRKINRAYVEKNQWYRRAC